MEQIIEAILSAIKFLYYRYQNQKAASDLKPYFNYLDVKAKRDLFVESKLQYDSPTREEEPGYRSNIPNKKPLIPFFIKTAFNEKKVSDKFYLVLADSGMGKTTFLINLFIRYNSFSNFNRHYNIKLFPFGYNGDILEKIKEIPKEEISKTILLLDAFDEYSKILPPVTPDGHTDDERFCKVLDEVVKAVQDFREVVITSRTQYLPRQEDKDYKLQIPSFDENGFHKLVKLYLSPFDDKEIRSYLNKKYGVLKFWNKKKKQKAFEIIHNSSKLMVRPMLLYYIDFLIEDNQQYSNTYQIYDALVNKWIEREVNKRKPYDNEREKFAQDLWSYSEKVALKIYEKRKEITNFQLPKVDAITIDVKLKQYQMTGQSLLTRDFYNNWKFAHRSILEFFLAKKIVDTIHSKNYDFALSFEFAGMDMARQFCSEILDPHIFALIGKYVRVKGGDFLMGSPDDEVDRFSNETQHEVRVSTFYLCKYAVTVADFHKFIADSGYLTDAERGGGSYLWDGKSLTLRAGVNWRHSIVGNEREVGEYNHPVLHVSWNDAVAYCHWLSEKTGKSFRLPSEAEWEYACRAGEPKPFSTGDNLTTAQANYRGDAPYNNNEKGVFRYNTVPVYYFKPNGWGLYNMHGNVLEWCRDWYGENYYDECKAKGMVENPQGIENGSYRVFRGGSWLNYAVYCRSAYRNVFTPGNRLSTVGFRLVFVP